MRIAFFSDSFYPELGGIQDSIALISRALGARGHSVVCYAPQPVARDFALAGKPVGEIDLGNNVTVRRFFSVPIPSPTQQSRFVPPTFERWRGLREFQPDIIHTHTFFGLGLEALRASQKLGVPFVGTNHSAVSEFVKHAKLFRGRYSQRASLRLLSWYYNHCELVTGPSAAILDEMKENGLVSPARVVSNPIDTAVFSPAADKAKLKKELGFSAATSIYAGRLGVEKNIDVIIRALALVRRDIPHAQLVLAGHGSDRPRLEALARELDIADAVRFLGTLSARDLARAFCAADVFAITSLSETQSMVLLQAMSCGIPAVAVDWRSFKEYVQPGTGLLARPGDQTDVARDLVTVLKDRAAAARMGGAARTFAQRYSIDAITKEWEALYAGVAKRG